MIRRLLDWLDDKTMGQIAVIALMFLGWVACLGYSFWFYSQLWNR